MKEDLGTEKTPVVTDVPLGVATEVTEVVVVDAVLAEERILLEGP